MFTNKHTNKQTTFYAKHIRATFRRGNNLFFLGGGPSKLQSGASGVWVAGRTNSGAHRVWQGLLLGRRRFRKTWYVFKKKS